VSRRGLALLLGVTLLASANGAMASPRLKLAITIDDLPVHGPTPVNETPQSIADRTIAALKAAHVDNVTGFVNGRWGLTQPASMGVVAAWRKAGLPIGNHSWSHANLGQIGEGELLGELGGNERTLVDYGRGSDWHWFRYPFLAEGQGERRLVLRRILAERHYRIAAVTMDFSDWQWTAPYARCVAAKDDRGITELKRLYLQSAREDIVARRFLSKELYGRDIPYVLLMHIGALDSYMLPQLLALYRDAGFSFVSLKEAERDPVYREDVDPRLPPREATLDGRASERGLAHPQATDFAAKLAAICPSPTL
jgi:peptidoglycan/xylan/chitin deacetylase (PgdA/CDA1 family)